MTADGLDELRERLRAAQEAAERIAGSIPPQGWATPDDDGRATAEEIRELAALLESLRELIPAEVADQLREVIRQLLLLLRAVIDLAIERLDEPPAARRGPAEDGDQQPDDGGEPAVQDIPIR